MTKYKWWIRTAAMRLTAFFCTLFGPKFAAWLTARAIRYVPGTSGINFVVMMRPSFDKDIAELSRHTGLGFVIVEKGFTRFQQVFLPRDRREQTYYQNAKTPFSGLCDPQAIYAAALLDQARKHAPIHGVLTANLDYWQDVGFKYQCEKQNLVFGVLCRENAIIPKIVDINFNRYSQSGYRFTGDFVVTAGKTSAQMFRDSLGVPEGLITPSGLPRYDVWQDAATDVPVVDRTFITLLTFTSGYAADRTFLEVLEAFVQTAQACQDRDLTFLIKAKDADDVRNLHRILVGRVGGNIRIDASIPMTQALAGSRVIVGYNSLSLIDALLSGSQIILPAWGECLTAGEMCMYPQTEDSMGFFDYVMSPQDLHDALDRFITAPPETQDLAADNAKQDYIARYVTYTPGRLNSTAFEQSALDHVSRKQANTS